MAARQNLEGELRLDFPRRDLFAMRVDILVKGTFGILLIENKPFDGSTFDGNQGSDGDYCDLVDWLARKMAIPTQYLVACSCSWNGFVEMKQIQRRLGSKFGIMLLEDVFANMARSGFVYEGLSEWGTFAGKGDDYVDRPPVCAEPT